MVQGIIRLADRYSKARIEAAAQRAIHFDNITYRAIKNILEKGLDLEPLGEEQKSETSSMEMNYAHARPVGDFTKQEDFQWN
ncbi:MAG: hypothetical protein FJ088_17190 [Deltaproteobacteria bacterium]|nr:hypothetical protein [Deltaproteobacteria bacterium]